MLKRVSMFMSEANACLFELLKTWLISPEELPENKYYILERRSERLLKI
jgi:hypothetical protein